MDRTLVAYCISGLSTLTAAVIGAWSLLRSKTSHTPADTQNSVNDGFEKLMKAYELRVDELEERLENDKKDCDEKIAHFRGEINALTQWAESMERILRRLGIPIPGRKAYGPSKVFLLGSGEANPDPPEHT